MYESISYESVLATMLEKVGSQYDKREGSIIMNALAPCAMEIYLAYLELDKIMDESFADTQSRDFLILRAAERGLSPKEASPSQWKCEFDVDIPTGSRFSCGDYTFIVSDNFGDGYYELTCEQSGSGSNSLSEELLTLQYIDGLSQTDIIELLVMGEEEESTEDFRTRYFDFVDAQAFGGNIADYKEKALAMDGVGAVKIIPIWDGAGTVKVIFTSSDYGSPSDELVADIQNQFDPDKTGEGNGLVPIGHVCTVQGVNTQSVNFSFDIVQTNSVEDIEELVEEAIDEYLQSLVEKWGDTDGYSLRISQVESKILEISYVADISNTKINSSTSNVTIASDTIAVRGEISANFT